MMGFNEWNDIRALTPSHATAALDRIKAEARDAALVEALVSALHECEAEIDAYIRQEYPGDHPVHEKYRQRDFSANPARAALAASKEPKP